jgi:uncharacterized protein YecT (DUF1311 family)
MRFVFHHRSAVLVVLFCFAATAIAAHPEDVSAAPNDGELSSHANDVQIQSCFDLFTNLEQKRCLEGQYRNAAVELETAYAHALERASKGDEASAIAESQRAWEIYRDAECKGVVGSGTGSGRMTWVWGCLAEKTKQRTIELNVPFYQR